MHKPDNEAFFFTVKQAMTTAITTKMATTTITPTTTPTTTPTNVCVENPSLSAMEDRCTIIVSERNVEKDKMKVKGRARGKETIIGK